VVKFARLSAESFRGFRLQPEGCKIRMERLMPHQDLPRFRDSVKAYERWLAGQLKGDLWKNDLDDKHEKMRDSPFVFLRATYWRWAETILTICGDLATAPIVGGVGDIHLENYGVWRDQEGRLVWGVNDFDEAADMPYAVDVVRLATSAILSRSARRKERRAICASVLEGYREGLKGPRPFSLDEDHVWLRRLFVVSENERRRFWKKMNRLKDDTRIPAKYRKAMESRMPGDDADVEKFARRAAGTGSLGRPRWVAVVQWRGGRLVREAKALVPSAWHLTHQPRPQPRPAASIATGRHRAPDPWYYADTTLVVRRLSPNARKIEVREQPDRLADPDMIRAMGHELANVHLGTGDAGRAIAKDLERRDGRWLERATDTAADFVRADYEEWR